jgi:hypothetical protein
MKADGPGRKRKKVRVTWKNEDGLIKGRWTYQRKMDLAKGDGHRRKGMTD